MDRDGSRLISSILPRCNSRIEGVRIYKNSLALLVQAGVLVPEDSRWHIKSRKSKVRSGNWCVVPPFALPRTSARVFFPVGAKDRQGGKAMWWYFIVCRDCVAVESRYCIESSKPGGKGGGAGDKKKCTKKIRSLLLLRVANPFELHTHVNVSVKRWLRTFNSVFRLNRFLPFSSCKPC